MRKLMPLILLLATACGESGPADGAPKSRTNEGGEIERHLRHIASDGPAARPFPTVAQRPTTAVLPDTETAPGEQAASEAARARAISEAHVHEHEHVDEPEVTEPTAATETHVAEAHAAEEHADAHPAEAHPAEARPAEAQVAQAEEVPAAEASADPAEPPAAPQVHLARVVAASSVVNREPAGAAPFSASVQEIYLFVEARNDGSPTTLEVRWIAPDGTPGRPVELQIPTSRRWRTWATTRRIHDRPGQWTAVVTDAAGRELGRSAFEISTAPSA